MSEMTTPAPGAAPSPVSAAWPFPRRLVAVFTSPRALFEHLSERPTWLVPMLLVTLVSAAAFAILLDPVIVPEQIAKLEESGQASDQAIEMLQGPFKYSILVTGMLAIPIVTLVYAAILLFLGSFLLGGRINFRQALALVAHTGLVSLPAALLKVPLAFATGRAEVTLGPGAFFSADQAEGFGAKFLASFLTYFDAFALWQTALVGLGLAVIARVPEGKSQVAVWTLFVIVAIVFSVLAAVFR